MKSSERKLLTANIQGKDGRRKNQKRDFYYRKKGNAITKQTWEWGSEVNRTRVNIEVGTDWGLDQEHWIEGECPGSSWIKKYEAQERNQTD